MMFVPEILKYLRSRGVTSIYGSPNQVNRAMQEVKFANSTNKTIAFVYLIDELQQVNGYEQANIGVYFARLCPFDFNGEDLLAAQEEMKGYGYALLYHLDSGNEITYDSTYVRWQFGYSDYAENVAWACMRATLYARAAECVPMGAGLDITDNGATGR